MGSPGGALVQLAANDGAQNAYLTSSSNLLNFAATGSGSANLQIPTVGQMSCELVCMRQNSDPAAYKNCMDSCNRVRNLVTGPQ